MPRFTRSFKTHGSSPVKGSTFRVGSQVAYAAKPAYYEKPKGFNQAIANSIALPVVKEVKREVVPFKLPPSKPKQESKLKGVFALKITV